MPESASRGRGVVVCLVWGGVWLEGCLVGGVLVRGAVWSGGWCAWSGGVCLVQGGGVSGPGEGGVSGPGGGWCAWSGGGGVPGPGGWCVWSRRVVCLVQGGCVPGPGGLPQWLVGYHSPPDQAHHPPPVNRMTNRCKNITLATTSLRPVKTDS